MPEYFDDEIPMVRRKTKNLRFYRNTKRYWPQDVLVKEIVFDDRHDYDIEFDEFKSRFVDYSNKFSYARRETIKAVNKVDKFGIKTIGVPISLNKNKRWEIPEKLSRRIVDFQDEHKRVRVSYSKEFVRDYQLLQSEWDYWDDIRPDDVKSYATEFISVKDSEEIRKFYKNAFPSDLLKRPNPCRKRSRKNRFSIEEDEIAEEDLGIHLIYKTKETLWDRRVQNKSQKIPQELNNKPTKKNIRNRDDSTALAFLTSDMDVIENSNNEIAYTSTCAHTIDRSFKVVFTECLVDENSKKRRKQRQKKKKCVSTNGDENLQASSYDFADEDYTKDIESIVSSSEESVLDEGMFMLSFIDINFPSTINFGDYIRERFPGARKVQHVYPETFLVYVSNETIGGTNHSLNDFNGWITCRVVARSDTDCTVRLILNADEDNKQVEQQEGSSKKLGPVEDIFSFLSDFLNPDVISTSRSGCDKNKLIKEWLSKLNEEYKTGEPTDTYCSVCFADDSDGFALSCGHHFCRFCWANNALVSIQQYQCPISCMMSGCSAVIEVEHIMGLIKRPFCENYKNILFNKLVLTKGWIYCEKCFALMIPKVTESSKAAVVVCECGGVACSKCKTSFHAPFSCDLAFEYRKLLAINGENMDEIVPRKKDRVQRCPTCMQCCSKTEGCHHIICVCGAEFCYVCGKRYRESISHDECDYEDEPEEVSLFDVASAPQNNVLQLAYEFSHIYRENRNSSAVRKLRKNVGREAEFAPILRCYIAANEVFELSSVYRLYKKLFEKVNKRKIENDLIHTVLIKQVDRMEFAFHRLMSTIENHNCNERLTEKVHILEDLLRDILSSGFLYHQT